MSLQKDLNIISRIDFLVRTRRTGSAMDLSHRLGISRRKLYRVIADMKDLGAPISWSKFYSSYVYDEPGRLEISFKKTS
jgi:predicted DNA-binding transcriptional regulator YafY